MIIDLNYSGDSMTQIAVSKRWVEFTNLLERIGDVPSPLALGAFPSV